MNELYTIKQNLIQPTVTDEQARLAYNLGATGKRFMHFRIHKEIK